MDIRSNVITQELTCALCGACYVPAIASAYDVPGLCPGCFSRDHYRELDRLISAKRKLAADIPHDLTLYQWLATISTFGGKCALCQLIPYQVLELWIPAAGVTASNVIPTCRSCSFHKLYGFDQACERISNYLQMPLVDGEEHYSSYSPHE